MNTKTKRVSASIFTAIFLLSAITAFAAPGDLDLSFSGDGKLTDWAGSGRGVALQPDGKMVVVGIDANGGSFVTSRYNPDGSPDLTFGGGDGIVTTDIGYSHEGANAVALQSDGKIVAVGTTWDGSGSQWGHFSLVRYNPDGSLDLTFGGGDGIVVTHNLGTGWVAANAVAIQSDGKIVAAGRTDWTFYDAPEFTVIRYNPDGSLDLPFGGGDAQAKLPWSNLPMVEDGTSLAIQADGKIVAAGYSWNLHHTVAVRLSSNGSLDGTFNGGMVIIDIRTGADVAHSVAIQPDGKIVTAGYSNNGSKNDFALVRYTSNGPLDTTFDSDGKVVTPLGPGNSAARKIAIQPDGKILAAGYTDNGPNADFALVRYNPDGSLDLTFGGGDGMVTADFGNSDDAVWDMAIDSSGRAVVVGESGGVLAIARFLGDSAVSNSATISGRVTTPGGQGLRNTVVTLTGQNGIRRTAMTGSMGFYVIENVPSGETYTATVSSRRYRFAARNISVTGDLTGVDFAGLE